MPVQILMQRIGMSGVFRLLFSFSKRTLLNDRFNCGFSHGETVLHDLVMRNDVSTAKVLFAGNTRPNLLINSTTSGKTALLLAEESKAFPLLSFLNGMNQFLDHILQEFSTRIGVLYFTWCKLFLKWWIKCFSIVNWDCHNWFILN